MPDVGAQLRDLVTHAEVDDLPDLIAALAGAQARALAKLTAPPRTSTPDKLVDAETMATLLDVPTNWVRDAARAERIPSLKLGHYVRFEPAAVMEAIKKLPPSHNSRLCMPKKDKETRGGRRPVSNECPSPNYREGAA